MGSYLRKPITEKVSEDESTALVKYGASSMQGWRISQEDAHNCCPHFDDSNESFLFAVYDGHGGAEVAEYASKKLPDFVKGLPQYKEGNLKEALVEAFLGFDLELLKPEVIDELKQLAGVQSDDEEQDEEEAEMLCEEADMPLERLMERYGGSGAAPAVKNLHQKEKFQSPMLRPKRDEAAEAGSGPGECDAGGGGDAAVKTKLADALLNGHDACGDSKVDSTQCDTNEAVSAKAEKAKDTSEGSAHNGVDTVDSTVADEDSPKSKAAGTVENEAASGCSSSADAVGSASNSNAGSGDSTAQGSSSSVPDSAGSAPKSSGGSGSSAPDSSGTTPTSGKLQQADSGSSTEPCSSSGRVRRKRRGVIPEEDESESSFDEDEEDTDEEDSDDDPEPWKTGGDEDDSSDEEDLEGEGAFQGELEGDEEDDEEEEVMCGGNEQPGEDSGCTAVVALVHNRQLLVSNAGDSRCVLCRGGLAIDMSVDHKPEDPEEQQRILLAGGRVTMDGRVNGGLNLSRALGDHCYKKNEDLSQREQMITALPDIKTIDLEDSDEFMVLACDGIWNVMSSQDVVSFVRDRIQAGVTKLSSICEELFDVCLAPDTTGDGTGCDNMTCIIVSLQRDGESLTKIKDESKVKDESLSQADQDETTAASTKRKAESGTSEAEAAPDSKRAKLEDESK